MWWHLSQETGCNNELFWTDVAGRDVTVWKCLITIIVTKIITVLFKCAGDVQKVPPHKSIHQVLYLKSLLVTVAPFWILYYPSNASSVHSSASASTQGCAILRVFTCILALKLVQKSVDCFKRFLSKISQIVFRKLIKLLWSWNNMLVSEWWQFSFWGGVTL